MRLESSVNLLVASLDLKLVQLVRGAMRAADEQGHPGSSDLIVPNPEIEPRRRFHPGPAIEPRPHVVPEPKIEARTERPVDGAYPFPCPPVVVVEAEGLAVVLEDLLEVAVEAEAGLQKRMKMQKEEEEAEAEDTQMRRRGRAC